jgi:hypothetical protein
MRKIIKAWWLRVLAIFSIIGPGIIAANADNDAGGITTYSVVGAQVVLVSPRAGSSMACAIGCDSLTAGPQDLDEGETTLFDHAGSRVDLKKDKSIVITSASGAVAKLTDSGDVYVVPAFGKSVNLGTTASGLLDSVVTKTLLNILVDEIRNHTHAVSGAATGIPVTPITDVNGSPNVKARKF